MALKTKLSQAEYDKLSDEVKKLYSKEGDAFELDYDGKDSVAKLERTVANVKKERDDAIKAAKDDLAAAKEALKNFDGIDPAEHTKLKKAVADRQAEVAAETEAKLKEKGEFDKLLTAEKDRAQTAIESAKADAKKAIEKANAEVSRLTAENENSMISSAVTSAISGHKGKVKLLTPHVQAMCKVVDVDGKKVIRIVNPTTGVAMSDQTGEYLTPDTFVASMKTDVETWGAAFEGSGQSGAGVNQNGGGDGGGKKPVILSRADASDHPTYEAAKKAAKEAGVELQIQ